MQMDVNVKLTEKELKLLGKSLHYIITTAGSHVIGRDYDVKKMYLKIKHTIGSSDNTVKNSEYHLMCLLLKNKIVNCGISLRTLNCLIAWDVDTVADLVLLSKHNLLRTRNFGNKSMKEVEDFLSSKGLKLGMDIMEYKLD